MKAAGWIAYVWMRCFKIIDLISVNPKLSFTKEIMVGIKYDTILVNALGNCWKRNGK